MKPSVSFAVTAAALPLRFAADRAGREFGRFRMQRAPAA